MINPFSRTERLFGKNAMQKLAASRVAVFGAGGVGGYVLEALARSGVGAIDIIDSGKRDQHKQTDTRNPLVGGKG